MNRSCLFMSGEWQVSFPLVMVDDEWVHTNIARSLVKNDDGTFSRNTVKERIKGCIFFADVESAHLRRNNLLFLLRENVPCWPNPAKILAFDDRFRILKMCVENGHVDHHVDFLTRSNLHLRQNTFPYVLKVGNCHRGEGKFLVSTSEEEAALQDWHGVASVEPFFEGESCRVLFVGNDEFVIHMTNPSSWIKNTEGADIKVYNNETLIDFASEFYPVLNLIRHARKIRDMFDFEMCGIDYIVNKDKFHFLEFNMFPGVGASPEIEAAASKLFRLKMNIIASEVKSKVEQLK